MADANFIPSASEVRRLFNYDHETGILTRLVSVSSNALAGDEAGTIDKDGYLLVGIRNRKYRLHRLAWLYFYGRWPEFEIDHINGNRADNSISNLRQASRTTNCQNTRKAYKNSKTGVLGVSKRRNRYRAVILIDGKHRQIGTFDTIEEAHSAYVEAKRKHHSGCTI